MADSSKIVPASDSSTAISSALTAAGDSDDTAAEQRRGHARPPSTYNSSAPSASAAIAAAVNAEVRTSEHWENDMTKRPDGALENDVLRALWMLDSPATPAEVIETMETDLAYTSIATILGRLCDKELAERTRVGRAFKYSATSDEADLTARRIATILDDAGDRASALAGFAKALDPGEIEQLAAILKEQQ